MIAEETRAEAVAAATADAFRVCAAEDGDQRQDSAPAESCFAEKAQRREMRFGGQYVAKTFPIRFPRGTEPQSRESHDEERLSPIMK